VNAIVEVTFAGTYPSIVNKLAENATIQKRISRSRNEPPPLDRKALLEHDLRVTQH
jgi:hypothetical protein